MKTPEKQSKDLMVFKNGEYISTLELMIDDDKFFINGQELPYKIFDEIKIFIIGNEELAIAINYLPNEILPLLFSDVKS